MVNDLPSDSETTQTDTDCAKPEPYVPVEKSSSPSPNSNESYKDQETAKRYLTIAYEWTRYTAWEKWIWPTIKNDGFWTAAATIIIAITTMVYTHYARKQWETMQRQLGEMAKQYPQLEKSAEAADKAAVTAQDSFKATSNQFRAEQRPYIWLTPGMAIPNNPMAAAALGDLLKSQLPLSLNMHAFNGGHSPAVEIVATKIVLVFDTPQNADRLAKEYRPQFLTLTDLAPNTGAYLVSPSAITLTQSFLDDLKFDRKRAYLLARVRYRDIFSPRSKEPYETAFCALVRPEGMPLATCGEIGQSWVK